jgi:hypothetical protein
MLELSWFVRRDHDDLNYALRVITESIDECEVEQMLDRVRRKFPAHAEAEVMALGAMLERTQPPPSLYFLVSQVIASHLAQETVLAQLLAQELGAPSFRERARYLRQLMAHHADHEAACLHPALPDHLPRPIYRTLGTSYAIERDRILDDQRKLACLEPVIARSA